MRRAAAMRGRGFAGAPAGAMAALAALLAALALAAACAAAGFAPAAAWADDEAEEGSAATEEEAAGEDDADASGGDADADADAEEEEEEEEAPDISDAETLITEDNEVDPTQLPDSSFIYDTSIEEMSEASTYYDGQTVQIVGEVVGDNLKASADGSYRWITLSSEDSDASISVYMNSESASKIDTYGDYAATGTILQVRGTFNLACEEHDGETDLHADVVTVTERGEQNDEEFDIEDFIPGIAVVCAGFLLMGLYYGLRERQR